jgi:DNA-binding NtrC family response regulator
MLLPAQKPRSCAFPDFDLRSRNVSVPHGTFVATRLGMQSASVYDLERQTDRTVLIVEDENVSRLALKRLLDRCGYHAQACGSAEEALNKLDDTDVPDVALVDVDLPGMSGLDLAAQIERTSPQTLTVLITAASGERINSFCRAHPVAYLQKPVNFDHLLSIINDVGVRH